VLYSEILRGCAKWTCFKTLSWVQKRTLPMDRVLIFHSKLALKKGNFAAPVGIK
jgi:hypothetical protein